MPTTTFYEQIDIVFEDLFNIYGIDKKLIDAKSKIIKFYLKDTDDDVIVNQLKKKYFKINEVGDIISVN